MIVLSPMERLTPPRAARTRKDEGPPPGTASVRAGPFGSLGAPLTATGRKDAASTPPPVSPTALHANRSDMLSVVVSMSTARRLAAGLRIFPFRPPGPARRLRPATR